MSVKLPLSLPIFFSLSGIKLPVNLPLSFAQEEEVNIFKIPTKETYWEFNGFLLEDYVVEKQNKPLTIKDEVRNRIMIDVEMIDRNTFALYWKCEQQIPKIEIYIKSYIEDNYILYSTHNWNDRCAIIKIDNSDYQVYMNGINGMGESGVIELGGDNPVKIDTKVNVAINQKVFDFTIDINSKYSFEVNL